MLLSTGRFFNGAAGGGGGPPPAVILDGLSPTGAWSLSRNLLSSFGGSRYTDVSGAVSSLNDQSGNSRNLTQATSGARPAITTAGPNSITCADFDGSDDVLAGAAISNFIANNSGYMIVSFIADAITLNVADPFENHGIMGDAAGYAGLHLKNTDADVGDPDSILAYNYDGTADAAASAAIVVGTAYVAEWRHEGGTVYVRANGGTEVSVASGNTQSIAGALQIGRSYVRYSNSKIFEAATFSTIPGSSTRNAVVADWMDHIGI